MYLLLHGFNQKKVKKECKPPYLDEGELKTNLGKGNFIFVGSGNDVFTESIPEEWIIKILGHCDKFDNHYLFQLKNPDRILAFINHPVFKKTIVCTTIETNIYRPEIMGNCPMPLSRAIAMEALSKYIDTYITIEPIMEFHAETLIKVIKKCNPEQVNSGHKKLPEPSKNKVLLLIRELEKFTKVKQKSNLERILK